MSELNKVELRRLIERLLTAGKEAGSAEYLEANDFLEEFLGDRSIGEVVISLLDENEQLRNQLRLAGISAELTVRDQVGRAVTSQFSAEIENAQLRAEVEALRKDAERYRWLRQRAGVDHMCGDYRAYVNTEKMTDLDLETTDAAIDAAMAKEGDANG